MAIDHSKSIEADVVIIGGGPAGAACALAIANAPQHNQRKVILVERHSYPRYKVCGCCLNNAAYETLDALGVADRLAKENAVPLNRWVAANAGRSVTAHLPQGWAISRACFDQQLIEAVREREVTLFQPANAEIESVAEDHVVVTVQQPGQSRLVLQASNVVIATGLTGPDTSQWLPWQSKPHGPIGVGALVEHPATDYQPGTIYMACGKSGYVGLVRIEDQRLDVAAAIYQPRGKRSADSGSSAASSSLRDQILAIIDASGFPQVPALESVPFKGTPPLTRKRIAGHHRLLAIGDAAGYIEPFTGEGMAWGLQSGVLAAQTLLASAPEQAAGDLYCAHYDRMLPKRRLICRFTSAALQRSLSRTAMFSLLTRAPWLSRPFIDSLNRTPAILQHSLVH